jgi:YegS/Rv2252/BmrU family lipid kinase
VSRRARLIVNPAAGGGRAARILPAVEHALQAHGVEFHTERAGHIEHARELARAAAEAGEVVVAFGGDGLAGACAGAIAGVPHAVLGVLPCGRGNDLARVLGIPSDPVAAAGVIATGRERDLDLGNVNGRTFVGIASAGFDSDANRIANEAPSWLGNLVYAYGALRALIAWRPARFELELLDGDDAAPQRRSFSGYSFAAANSRAYGGGMFIAPDAELDDGLLDVVFTEHVSKLRFVASLPKVFSGRHVDNPEVHVVRTAQLKVSADRPFTVYADGDPIAELPATIGIVPRPLRVLVP